MKDLIKKDKHDHKLTNILKFVIFTIVMLAPFIAILSKIVYVSANKNAKDSYYGETINDKQFTQITTYDEFTINNDYRFTLQTNQVQNNNGAQIYYDNLVIIDSNYTDAEELKNYTRFYLTWADNRQYIIFQKNGLTDRYIDSVTKTLVFEFTLVSYSKGTDQNMTLQEKYNGDIVKITYNKYSYLDNVIYYAIDQSKEEELLKWTKNTPIYNAINSMNTGLGLSSNHILTYLLTYWSIMIAIYIIFDIIIFALTKLTHWLN